MKTPKTTEKTLRDAVLDVLCKDVRALDTHLIDLQCISEYIIHTDISPTEVYIKNIDDLRMINHEATIILGDDIETSEEDFIAMVESGEITIKVDPDVLELDGVKITPLKTTSSTTIDIEWTTYHLAAQYVIETGPSSLTIVSSLKYCPIDGYSELRIMDNYGDYVDDLVQTGEIVVTSNFSDLIIDTSDEYVRIQQNESNIFDQITITAVMEKWNISGELKLISIPYNQELYVRFGGQTLYYGEEIAVTGVIYAVNLSGEEVEVPWENIYEFFSNGWIEWLDHRGAHAEAREDSLYLSTDGDEYNEHASISYQWIDSSITLSFTFTVEQEAHDEIVYFDVLDNEDPSYLDIILDTGYLWDSEDEDAYHNDAHAIYGNGYGTEMFAFYQSSNEDIEYLMKLNRQDTPTYHGVELLSSDEMYEYMINGTYDEVNPSNPILDDDNIQTCFPSYLVMLISSSPWIYTTIGSYNTDDTGTKDGSECVTQMILQFTFDGTTWEDVGMLYYGGDSVKQRASVGFSFEIIDMDPDATYNPATGDFSKIAFALMNCCIIPAFETSPISYPLGLEEAYSRFLEQHDGKQVLGVRIMATCFIQTDPANAFSVYPRKEMDDSVRHKLNKLNVWYYYLWSKFDKDGNLSDDFNNFYFEPYYDWEGEYPYDRNNSPSEYSYSIYFAYNTSKGQLRALHNQPFSYIDATDKLNIRTFKSISHKNRSEEIINKRMNSIMSEVGEVTWRKK